MNRDNYYCVIMAGGTGSRFWPYSRKNMPKQFLDFFGTGQTLLQQTFQRYKEIIPVEQIYISTNTDYKDLVLQQLPEIKEHQLLVDETHRNTAPAVVHAAFYLKQKNPDAIMIIAPSDHLILKPDNFIASINKGLEFVEKNRILLTIGIKPTHPETGYGYIQVEENKEASFYSVKTFVEKPAIEFAQFFVNSGEFYWNSGIFIWKADDILHKMHLYSDNIFEKGECKEPDFTSCPNIPIDYAVMEKTENVFVQDCDFGWADLGTFGALYDAAPKDINQNATLNSNTMLYDCKDNIVLIPKDKLAVIEGLENYLVTLNDNVLLICKKDNPNNIRKFVNDVQMKFDEKYL